MHQHTGNWPGQTVENASGICNYKNKNYRLIDLPGTYSLMSHSEEEEIARNYICFGKSEMCIRDRHIPVQFLMLACISFRDKTGQLLRLFHKNNKILATTFNDEKFFTVRRIIIYSISILDFQRILRYR